MDVCYSTIPATVMVGELFVIDTHQMKNRGVVVVHMTWAVG